MTEKKYVLGMIVNEEEKHKVKTDAVERRMSVSDHLRTSAGLHQVKERKENYGLQRKG